MRHPIRIALLAASLILGCEHAAYGPSSDDRLTSEVNDSAEMSAPRSQSNIQACDDLSEKLARARNGARPEADRLRSYMELYHTLSGRLTSNQAVFDRRPELVYGGGKGQAMADWARAANERCTQMQADTRSEFEILVRDLFDPLIITDLQNHRRVPRVSFALLQSAVEELKLGDSPSLLDRIATAKRVLGRR